MRLQYVAMCGFRGFKEPTRIEFAPGFSVIAGPNGSGKSTVCDAIEFGLVGRIRQHSDHTERNEGIADYLWWRGAGTPQESYVELGLVSESGREFKVRRSPSIAFDAVPPELSRELILDGASLSDPLLQLCRTAILRDEDITRVSVDLGEADRFRFVQQALGFADFAAADTKVRATLDYLKAERDVRQKRYEAERGTVSDLAERLSAKRSEASRVNDPSHAERVLRVHAPGAATIADLLRDAEVVLARYRSRADSLTAYYSKLSRLLERLGEQSSDEVDHELAALADRAADRESELESAREELASAAAVYEELRSAAPRLSSIAQLEHHGSRVGLIDGACPLCGLAQDDERFEAHLRALRQSIEETDAELARRTASAAASRTRVDELEVQLIHLREQVHARSHAKSILVAEVDAVVQELRGVGVAVRDPLPLAVVHDISSEIESLRERSSQVEAALTELRASFAVAELAEGEQELVAARERMTMAERALARLDAANDVMETSRRTIRRVQGELVDEQLAMLSPLLTELFQRLRPHVDWRTIRYNLRGDVRRMLSLEVGEGVNPSFVFSSGQRRAAGLAFWLAIHLSRAWCGLRTLVLDDPVQHVDDFRALHLVEVLGGIRRDGRQIICTTEDSALADFMARRFRSHASEEGAMIHLGYEAGTGARLLKSSAVLPQEVRVLVA